MTHPKIEEIRDKKVEKLLWLDLEMGGLDPGKDKVLEIAAVVTDLDLRELGKIDLVIHQSERALKKINAWSQETFTKNGLLQKIKKSKLTQKLAEEKFLKFIDKYFDPETPIILAGDSIYYDRCFISRYFKKIEKRLHYRMLDATSFWILFKDKYGKSLEFSEEEKKKAHLASMM